MLPPTDEVTGHLTLGSPVNFKTKLSGSGQLHLTGTRFMVLTGLSQQLSDPVSLIC